MQFNVDVEGLVPEFDQFMVEADDKEHAEHLALERIREEYPHWTDGEIVRMQEI